MLSPDVLVVGAGVVGAAIAAHAAARGLRVTIVDRAPAPGTGSTGRATGGFRSHFETGINVRLSELARRQITTFAETHGVDPDFRPVGYLFLAQQAATLSALRAAVAVQHAAGVTTSRLLSVDEAAAIAPHARLDGVLGASWAPQDGYIAPRRLLEGFLATARRHGVALTLDAPVTRMDTDASGRITAVHAGGDRLTPHWVVNAAGAWAAQLAALIGLDVPVRPVRRCVVPTVPGRALDPALPMTIWTDDGFHVRVRDDDALLGWMHAPVRGVDDAYTPSPVDAAWIAHARQLANARVPALRDVPLAAGAAWSGLYEVSPDHHAVLGPHPSCANLLLANGSSGHGVMHAAALGLLAAEWLADGAFSSLDAAPLRPSRFAEGDAILSPALL